MSASRHFARLLATALLLALPLFATKASADAGSALSEVRTTLATAGLLDDPLALAGAVTTLGEVRITHHLSTSEPLIDVTWDSRDAAGQPVAATVRIARRVTGQLDIERSDVAGRARFARKRVDDDAVRQVSLRFTDGRWRVTAMSAVVLASRGGRTSLPLVDLNTRAVSSGHLSVLSDLDELAVLPQTCAVTPPGDSVRVFVSGVARDAVVTVFANGHSFAAKADGCPRCSKGYKGRFALLETMLFTETLKRMVVQSKPVQEIKQAAIGEGMVTLRRAAILNAMRGKTSLEEVVRVTLAD